MPLLSPCRLNKTLLACALSSMLLGRFAMARDFDSILKLKVYARGSGDVPDRVLGFTPVRKGHPIHLPEGQLWYIRPAGELNAARLGQLGRLIRQEKIPGLDLSDHWELTDESLLPLRALPTLVMLDISRTKISNPGLSSVATYSALSVLLLPDNITDEGLAMLKPLRQLRELNLDQTRLTDHGLSVLSRHVTLRHLDLSSTRVTDAGLAWVAKLPDLRRLVLGPNITDVSAPHLRALKRLNEIDISQTQIGEPGLAALASLPALKTLYLGKQANDAALKALSTSRSLKSIDLTRTAVTDEGIASLSQVKTLEEIALSQTSVGNACLPLLATLPNLRLLELSDTRVTSTGLAPLARLKKLEVISLSWQKLAREDLQGMAKLKQLKTIVLNGVPLPETTMVQLRRLGTPSPWETIDGIERTRWRETKKSDQVALSAPVALQPAASTRMLPELRQPSLTAAKTSAPSSRSYPEAAAPATAPHQMASKKQKTWDAEMPRTRDGKTVSVPSKPDSITTGASSPAKAPSVLEVASLKDAGRVKSPLVDTAPRQPGDAVAPTGTPAASAARSDAAKPETEENLLRVIALQSNPTRAGAFSGLAGMRQVRHTETLAALNSIAAASVTPAIPSEEDKPQNYLGDLSVEATRSR